MPAKNELGLIHIYTGNGKGKTTASLGLALRAIGHGYKVYVIQFMKGGRFIGELLAAEKYLKGKMKFAQFGQSTPFEEEIRRGELKPSYDIFLPFENESEQMYKALHFAHKIVKSRKYSLVILDEINVAMSMGHIKPEHVLQLMLAKPKDVELVLTGRGAPQEIIDAADYANEINPMKHPFDRNKKVLGRRGVEY